MVPSVQEPHTASSSFPPCEAQGPFSVFAMVPTMKTFLLASECVEVIQDLEWNENGLEGTIPDVPVLVDPDTGEMFYLTADSSRIIGAWRRKEMARRNLSEKLAEAAALRSACDRLKQDLDTLDRLGFCTQYGIDEVKMASRELFTPDGSIDWEKVYEMDRNTSSTSQQDSSG